MIARAAVQKTIEAAFEDRANVNSSTQGAVREAVGRHNAVDGQQYLFPIGVAVGVAHAHERIGAHLRTAYALQERKGVGLVPVRKDQQVRWEILNVFQKA